jgi:hypothetical protein
MLRCGSAGARSVLRLARQEHGDAGDNGEDGESDGDEFENGHGGSPDKHCDVAVQYM